MGKTTMAKQRKPAVNATTLTGFSRPPQTSNVSYSGDKPNPHLRAFVESKATPYDPATDDYDVPAFNKPIETTKATAIYNMHVYWSKKPHTAIRQYIRHFTKPGDIVLDPFSGSGGTALAACWTREGPLQLTAARPQRSSPRIIAHPSIRTSFARRISR
jgi:hypothetical protein